jgi:uncharacterized membrane protein YeaQ/YmgE (transglycosylase-associated protein family)
MTNNGLLLKVLAAVIGCFAGAYIGQELLGGAALGWTVTGAIVAVFCYPLFKALMERRARP